MSGQLVIDPERFARDRGRLSGVLGAADLPRLSEQIAAQERDAGQPGADRTDDRQADAANWSIEYEVTGHLDDHGRAALHLRLRGEVELRCQRCLATLPTRIEAERKIVLVPGADAFAPFGDEDESTDVIPAVPRLDLCVLLEDEVLLGLPLAPRHVPGACAPQAAAPQAQAVSSPFAALARLRQQ